MIFGRGKRPRPMPGTADECVAQCRKEEDPREKRRLLERALTLEPENLRANRAMLMLGGLGAAKRNEPDFSLIKCYLLTVFEKPDVFTPEKRREMAREIFDHPLLLKCLGLCPEEGRDKFLLDYIQEMCDTYGQLFIASSSEHSGSLLGFSTAGSRGRAQSAPFAAMLTNILDSADLSVGERMALLRALHQSARTILGGDAQRLYDRLEPRVIAALEE